MLSVLLRLQEKCQPTCIGGVCSVATKLSEGSNFTGLGNTPAIVFRDSSIVWVIHLLFR